MPKPHRIRTQRSVTIDDELARKAADLGKRLGHPNLSRVIDLALAEWLGRNWRELVVKGEEGEGAATPHPLPLDVARNGRGRDR